jgi:hypothetical protein
MTASGVAFILLMKIIGNDKWNLTNKIKISHQKQSTCFSDAFRIHTRL